MKKDIDHSKAYKPPITGAYITQPNSQPDTRAKKTDVALPDDYNVCLNRDWSIENKK
ncbi:MAG: hypothetical protein RR911_00565 [Oscillospiraceae bacterium]